MAVLTNLFAQCNNINEIEFDTSVLSPGIKIDLLGSITNCSNLQKVILNNISFMGDTGAITSNNMQNSIISNSFNITDVEFKTCNFEKITNFSLLRCGNHAPLLKNIVGLENLYSPLNVNFSRFDIPLIENLNINGWNFPYSNFGDTQQIYGGNLKEVNMKDGNFQKIGNSTGIFYGLANLINVDISNGHESNMGKYSGYGGININELFYQCNNLKNVNMSNGGITNVHNVSETFYNCFNLTSINMENTFFPNITSINLAFHRAGGQVDPEAWYDVDYVLNLDLGNGNTSKATSLVNFLGFAKLGNCNLNIGNGDVSNVTNMHRLFFCCQFGNNQTAYLGNLSNGNTSKVKDMYGIFHSTHFADINTISTGDVSNVTNMHGAFSAATIDTSVLSNGNVSKVTDMYGIFQQEQSTSDRHDAILLTGLENGDVSNVTTFEAAFEYINSNFNPETLGIYNGNVSNAKGLQRMFSRSNFAINSINLSNGNVAKVTNISDMFSNVQNLTTINLSNGNVSNVTDASYLFFANGLIDIDLTNGHLPNSCKILDIFGNGQNSYGNNSSIKTFSKNTGNMIANAFPYYTEGVHTNNEPSYLGIYNIENCMIYMPANVAKILVNKGGNIPAPTTFDGTLEYTSNLQPIKTTLINGEMDSININDSVTNLTENLHANINIYITERKEIN